MEGFMGKSAHRVATTMHIPFTKWSGSRGRNRGFNNLGRTGPSLPFEALESRQLLSITLPAISNVTLPAGTTMYVPLKGTAAGPDAELCGDGFRLFQGHARHDADDQQDAGVQRRHQRHHGDDGLSVVRQSLAGHDRRDRGVGQLGVLQRLADLPQRDDQRRHLLSFKAATIRPPAPSRPTHANMAEEFNPNLEYTSAGMLAMARHRNPGTSSTEFFITGEATRSLDFSYTIFGMQTSGFDVFNQIAAMADENSTDDPNGIGYLQTPVTITSASIITNSQTGMLQISAPRGSDRHGDGYGDRQRRHQYAGDADLSPSRCRPIRRRIPPIRCSPRFRRRRPAFRSFHQAVTSTHGDELEQLEQQQEVEFLVSGVTSGNVVEMLCDGNVIGQATASGTTVTVTTDGSTTLTDGLHTFTAIQIAKSQTVSVTETGSSTRIEQDGRRAQLQFVQCAIDGRYRCAAVQFPASQHRGGGRPLYLPGFGQRRGQHRHRLFLDGNAAQRHVDQFEHRPDHLDAHSDGDLHGERAGGRSRRQHLDDAVLGQRAGKQRRSGSYGRLAVVGNHNLGQGPDDCAERRSLTARAEPRRRSPTATPVPPPC